MKFSMRSLLVGCLILFLVFAATYERNRANRLAMQMDRLERPMTEAIQKQEWLIHKRELALKYAKDALPTFEGEYTGTDISGMPMGFRRELANIRNAQLKLSREEAELERLKKELMEHRARLEN
jgi:hypothetical protein